jgi:hypothetical protein
VLNENLVHIFSLVGVNVHELALEVSCVVRSVLGGATRRLLVFFLFQTFFHFGVLLLSHLLVRPVKSSLDFALPDLHTPLANVFIIGMASRLWLQGFRRLFNRLFLSEI